MKTVIWKWTLRVTDEQIVEIPEGAQILSVQMQGDMPQLWALCKEDKPKVPRRILIYGTGNPIVEYPGKYISTFQMHGGALVFHTFEGGM